MSRAVFEPITACDCYRQMLAAYAAYLRGHLLKTVPLCSGDFRPWSKDELQTMKDAGDSEANKLERETGAKPSASSSKASISCLPLDTNHCISTGKDVVSYLPTFPQWSAGHLLMCQRLCWLETNYVYATSQGRKKQQQQQMQEQQAQNIEAGRPRVWVPGQGWVAIDPDWERQDDATNDAQARSSEQNQAGPSQDRARGYDADSETDGNELHGPPSHKPDADKPVTDGADPKENQEQHGDEEQRESMPVQSAYALRQGVQVSKDSDHERKEQDTAEGPQDEAERAWGAVTKQTEQEKASSKNQASGSTERQEESESSERNQQDDNVSASSTAGGQQQQTTAEPSRSSMEQEEAIRERRLHRGKVDCMPPFASLPSAPLQKLQTLPSQALPPNRFLTS